VKGVGLGQKWEGGSVLDLARVTGWVRDARWAVEWATKSGEGLGVQLG
jgi:hypothetical protein